MGRYAETRALGLEAAGVKWEVSDGKIRCVDETTNVPHIHAIGDVVYVSHAKTRQDDGKSLVALTSSCR